MPTKSRTSAEHVAKIITLIKSDERRLGELCQLIGITDERNNRTFIHYLLKALIDAGLVEIRRYALKLEERTFKWKEGA